MPLISVLGLSGIGKVSLVRKFIDLNLDKFEVIIWKDLQLSNFLSEILTEILANVTTSEVVKNSAIENFLSLLQNKKCLIIFDNVEKLFISSEFAGQFKPEHKHYEQLLIKIKKIQHQSSLILINQELGSEICYLNLFLLELKGLFNYEIFNNLKLKDHDYWLDLVNLYGGNSRYLQKIALLIKDFYDGKVKEFLAENTLHITQNMLNKLNSLFNRLSSQEKEIIFAITKLNKPVSRDHLKQSVNLSFFDLINSLNSLKSRFLLIEIKENKILFDLAPVFKQFIFDK